MVIGIITILSAIVIIAINPARQFAKARNAQRRSDVRELANAVDQNRASNNGILNPLITTQAKIIGTTSNANYINLGSILVPGFLTSIPTDPISGTQEDTKYIIYRAPNDRAVIVAENSELNEIITSTGTHNPVLGFNGGNQYVQIPHNAGLDIGTGDFSLAVWVQASPGGYQSIFTRDVAGAGGGLILDLFTGSGVPMAWVGGSFSASSTSVTDGLWHHIVITRTSGTLQYYIDAVPDTSASAPGSINQLNSNAIVIGGKPGVSYPFNGKVDDLRFYNRAISPTEVQNLFMARGVTHASSVFAGMLGYWPLDEGVGTTVNDWSGVNGIGTASGGPTWSERN